MDILLTGYHGFIGGRLYQKLTELGHRVTGIEKSFEGGLVRRVLAVDLIFHVGAISDTSLEDQSEMLKY